LQCPISNAYNERIRALAEDYAKQSVTFLAINASAPETIADIKAHATQHNFAFPILKDTGNKVADAYGAGTHARNFCGGCARCAALSRAH
jgi:peroxiredoxin